MSSANSMSIAASTNGDPIFEACSPKASPRSARIMLARDLSLGGMRIDRDPQLEVGATLRMALHDPERQSPLELDAEVLRDDGEEGWALTFQRLSSEVETQLEKLIAKLPDHGGDFGQPVRARIL